MKKSIQVLQEIKRYLTMLAPLFLLIGAAIYIALDYTNRLTHPALKVLASFGFCLFAFMAINIAQMILYILVEKKEGKAFQPKEVCKSNFVNKTHNFMLKYEKYIGLAFSVLCLISAILLITLFFGKDIKHYWNVYYYLSIAQICLTLYAVFTIFVSKDKKSLIINTVLTTLLLFVTIWMTVNANIMMFGEIGVTVNMLEHNILLVVFSLLLFLPFGFVSTHGSFADFKATTNFGLGFLGLFFGVFAYEIKAIVQRLLAICLVPGYEKDAYYFLNIGHTVAYIILGVVFALCLGNLILNFRKFIKTKNWLGLVDIACSLIGVVICILGVFNFTQFLLFYSY